MKRVLVAVIAYNEGQNLRNTLRDLRLNGPAADILVIDNGSTDDTRAVALAHGVPVLSHCINSGSSMGTVMSYFLYAYRNHYDCLCQFDGDGQHIASELARIIEPVLQQDADYVIGSRFLKHEGFQSTFVRRIAIRVFAWTRFSFLSGKIDRCDIGIPCLRSAGYRTIRQASSSRTVRH